jgi:chromosome segregation ATPase
MSVAVPHRIAVAALAVACAAAAVLVARDWAATRGATRDTAARLAEARAALDDTAADLDDTRGRIDAGEANLRGQRAVLAVRVTERTEAQAEADAAGAWLAALQAELHTATAELDASTGKLDSLHTCLAGVAQALNQLAARDAAGVAVTVRGIEGPCAAAGVML